MDQDHLEAILSNPSLFSPDEVAEARAVHQNNDGPLPGSEGATKTLEISSESPDLATHTLPERRTLTDELKDLLKKAENHEKGVYEELLLVVAEAKHKVAQLTVKVKDEEDHIVHMVHDYFRSL